MIDKEKPSIYYLPTPSSVEGKEEEVEVKVEDLITDTMSEGEELSLLVTKSWDPRILTMFSKGQPKAEIARVIGRSTAYINGVIALPEFQLELRELRGELKEDYKEETNKSIKSAKEMRQEALKALHLELMTDGGSPAGRIASAKVLLDEAHREDMQNRGERERPLSLNEVRRMSITEAQDLAKEYQIRRSK